MLADPITIAAASPTPELKLAMIRHDNYGAERLDTNGGGYSLVINHERSRSVTRHYLRMSKVVDAVNPYSGVTQPKTASVSLSISRPEFGFDDNAMVALIKALTDTLNDSEVTPLRILQFQS
jgi:hypothetical protein